MDDADEFLFGVGGGAFFFLFSLFMMRIHLPARAVARIAPLMRVLGPGTHRRQLFLGGVMDGLFCLLGFGLLPLLSLTCSRGPEGEKGKAEVKDLVHGVLL